MTLTFSGTADGHSSPTRQHSGIFVSEKEFNFLFDCGCNVGGELLKIHRDPDTLDGVWISHAHNDHIANFNMLIQSLWLRKRRRPLPVFAPEKLIEFLQHALLQTILFPELIGFPIEWHTLTPKFELTCSTAKLTAFPTQHLDRLKKLFVNSYPNTCFDCFGATFTINNRKYAYSADLAFPQDLNPIWETPVEGLICELTHFGPNPLLSYLADKPIKQLWITHYNEALIGKQNEIRQIAKELKLKIKLHLAQDGETITIT